MSYNYLFLNNKLWLLLSFALLVSVSGLAQEQPDKISSGRPDLTAGTYAVPHKAIQIETGLTLWKESEEGKDIRARAYPEVLVRIGILRGVELRLNGMIQDSVIREQNSRRKVKGAGPFNAGIRVQLWDQNGLLPKAAIQSVFTLPIGSEEVAADKYDPQFILALAHELTDKLDLTYNLGYGWTDGDPEKSYGLNLEAELSDKWMAYIEALGEKQEGEDAEHFADMGIMFLIRNNIQLDVGIGTKLNAAAPDLFLTTGISIRLPR